MAKYIKRGVILWYMIYSSAAFAQSLEYRFHWTRVPLANLEITLADNPVLQGSTQREIAVQGSTIGAVGKFLQYQGQARSTPDANGLMYSLAGIDNGFSEHRTIYFPANDAPQIIDFLDDEIEAPGPDEMQQVGPAINPLALLVQLMQSPLGSGCQGQHNVFDGKRLMQISARSMGMEKIQQDRSWSWAGEAFRCDMHIVSFELAGEVSNPQAVDDKAAWLRQDEQVRSLWMAELAMGGSLGSPQIRPVRFSVPGPLGRVKGRLVVPES